MGEETEEQKGKICMKVANQEKYFEVGPIKELKVERTDADEERNFVKDMSSSMEVTMEFDVSDMFDLIFTKMKRKRFIKLLMSIGYDRNESYMMADYVKEEYKHYYYEHIEILKESINKKVEE